MNPNLTDLQRTSFLLGPFEVLGRALSEPSLYILYTIMVDGIAVRRQISYPEETDGWIGYARAVQDKVLTLEEQEAFRVHCLVLHRRIKPVQLSMGPIRLPYGYAGRPKKVTPVA